MADFKAVDHSVTRARVNLTLRQTVLSRLAATKKGDLVIEIAPSYYLYDELFSNYGSLADFHFIFAHGDSEKFEHDEDKLSTAKFNYSYCFHSPQLQHKGCTCSGLNWSQYNRVFLIVIDVIYHYNYYQGINFMYENAAKCNPKPTVTTYISLKIPGSSISTGFNGDHLNMALRKKELGILEPNHVVDKIPEPVVTLVNKSPSDIFSYKSDFNKIAPILAGGIQLSNSWYTYSKIGSDQDYVVFNGNKRPSRGMTLSSITPWSHDHRTFCVPYSETVNSTTGEDYRIKWAVVVLSRTQIQSIMQKLTANMTVPSLFTRALTACDCPTMYAIPLMLMLYMESVNTLARSLAVSCSQEFSWNWNKGFFDTIIKELSACATPGVNEASRAFSKVPNIVEMITSCVSKLLDAAKTVGMIVLVGATLTAFSMSIDGASIVASIGMLCKYLLEHYKETHCVQARMDIIQQKNLMKINNENFFEFLRNPTMYDASHVPYFMINDGGEFALDTNWVSSYKGITDMPTLTLYENPNMICMICTDQATETIRCEDCHKECCLVHQTLHVCHPKVAMPGPKTINVNFTNLQPGPIDVLGLKYVRKSDDLPRLTINSGNIFVHGEKGFFLGGTLSNKSRAYRLTNGAAEEFSIMYAYGHMAYHFSKMGVTIDSFDDSDLNLHNEYLNGSCFDYTFRMTLGTISSGVKKRKMATCIHCKTLAKVVQPRKYKDVSFKTGPPHAISFGTLNVPHETGPLLSPAPLTQSKVFLMTLIQDKTSTELKEARYLRHGVFISSEKCKIGDNVSFIYAGQLLYGMVFRLIKKRALWLNGPGVAYGAMVAHQNTRPAEKTWRMYMHGGCLPNKRVSYVSRNLGNFCVDSKALFISTNPERSNILSVSKIVATIPIAPPPNVRVTRAIQSTSRAAQIVQVQLKKMNWDPVNERSLVDLIPSLRNDYNKLEIKEGSFEQYLASLEFHPEVIDEMLREEDHCGDGEITQFHPKINLPNTISYVDMRCSLGDFLRFFDVNSPSGVDPNSFDVNDFELVVQNPIRFVNSVPDQHYSTHTGYIPVFGNYIPRPTRTSGLCVVYDTDGNCSFRERVRARIALNLDTLLPQTLLNFTFVEEPCTINYFMTQLALSDELFLNGNLIMTPDLLPPALQTDSLRGFLLENKIPANDKIVWCPKRVLPLPSVLIKSDAGVVFSSTVMLPPPACPPPISIAGEPSPKISDLLKDKLPKTSFWNPYLEMEQRLPYDSPHPKGLFRAPPPPLIQKTSPTRRSNPLKDQLKERLPRRSFWNPYLAEMQSIPLKVLYTFPGQEMIVINNHPNMVFHPPPKPQTVNQHPMAQAVFFDDNSTSPSPSQISPQVSEIPKLEVKALDESVPSEPAQTKVVATSSPKNISNTVSPSTDSQAQEPKVTKSDSTIPSPQNDSDCHPQYSKSYSDAVKQASTALDKAEGETSVQDSKILTEIKSPQPSQRKEEPKWGDEYEEIQEESKQIFVINLVNLKNFLSEGVYENVDCTLQGEPILESKLQTIRYISIPRKDDAHPIFSDAIIYQPRTFQDFCLLMNKGYANISRSSPFYQYLNIYNDESTLTREHMLMSHFVANPRDADLSLIVPRDETNYYSVVHGFADCITEKPTKSIPIPLQMDECDLNDLRNYCAKTISLHQKKWDRVPFNNIVVNGKPDYMNILAFFHAMIVGNIDCNQLKGWKGDRLEFYNFIEAILLSIFTFQWQFVRLDVIWIDGPGGTGKTEAFIQTSKSQEFSIHQCELISQLAASAVNGNTYQKAYFTRSDITCFDEGGLWAIQRMMLHTLLKHKSPRPIIAFGDLNQIFGLGNHANGLNSIPLRRLEQNDDKISLIKNDGATVFEYRSFGPFAEYIYDYLYGIGSPFWTRHRRLVAPAKTDSKTDLVVIPYADNISLTELRKLKVESVIFAQTEEVEKFNFDTVMEEGKTKKIQKSDKGKTIMQTQGVTYHNPIAVFFKHEGNGVNSLLTVALTRATNVLYLNQSLYNLIFSDKRALRTIMNGELIPRLSVVKTNKSILKLEEVMKKLTISDSICKTGKDSLLKFATIAERLPKDKFLSVVDLTPGRGLLRKCVTNALEVKDFTDCTRDQFEVKMGSRGWITVNSFSHLRNVLFIIDAPTTPKFTKGQYEYIPHEVLLAHVNQLLDAGNSVLFKSSKPLGLGVHISHDYSVYDHHHNPQGLWQNLEWYFYATPEKRDECLGSFRNPNHCIPSFSNVLPQIMPIPMPQKNHSYEVWITTSEKYEAQPIIVECPNEEPSQLNNEHHPDFAKLWFTYHSHPASKPQASQSDEKVILSSRSYASACHFIVTKDGETVKCFHRNCDKTMTFNHVNDTFKLSSTDLKVKSRTIVGNFSSPKKVVNDLHVASLDDPENFETNDEGHVPMLTAKKFSSTIKTIPPFIKLRPDRIQSYNNNYLYSHKAPLKLLNPCTPANFKSNFENKLTSFVERLARGPSVNLWIAFLIANYMPQQYAWMIRNGKIPHWNSFAHHIDYYQHHEKWIKNKPPHRKTLYRRYKDIIRIKGIRNATTFVKDEKIELKPNNSVLDETVPRNIVSVNPMCANICGQLADMIADDWIQDRKDKSSGGKLPEDGVTCTVSMTGEDLAEDLRARPATIDSDFGKYDRSIHFLVKLILLRLMVVSFIFGKPITIAMIIEFDQNTLYSDFLKRVFDSKYQTFFNEYTFQVDAICRMWYVVIKNPEFTCVLFGKTFSGDWSTLIFNCILTAFFICLVASLYNYTTWFARVMGDDTNNNLPDDMFNDTAFILSYIGMQLTGESRTNQYQTYNSQMMCIDTNDHAFLTPQNVQKALKAFYVPYERLSAPTKKITKFQLMVIRNQNFVNKFSGDPLIKKITELSIQKYGIIKTFDEAKYNYIMRNNIYKATNIHTHKISEESLALLAENAYATTARDFMSVVNSLTEDSEREIMILVRLKVDHTINFYADKTTSLFDTANLWRGYR